MNPNSMQPMITTARPGAYKLVLCVDDDGNPSYFAERIEAWAWEVKPVPDEPGDRPKWSFNAFPLTACWDADNLDERNEFAVEHCSDGSDLGKPIHWSVEDRFRSREEWLAEMKKRHWVPDPRNPSAYHWDTSRDHSRGAHNRPHGSAGGDPPKGSPCVPSAICHPRDSESRKGGAA